MTETDLLDIENKSGLSRDAHDLIDEVRRLQSGIATRAMLHNAIEAELKRERNDAQEEAVRLRAALEEYRPYGLVDRGKVAANALDDLPVVVYTKVCQVSTCGTLIPDEHKVCCTCSLATIAK